MLVAATPLTVTVFGPDTGESPAGVTAPVTSGPAAFTGPPPVKYATKVSPTLAGEVGEFMLPSGFTTTARSFPYTTIPGVPVAGIITAAALLVEEPFFTTTVATPGLMSSGICALIWFGST